MALQMVGGPGGKRGAFHRGWRLRYSREDAGLTVQEMAARLGVERGTVTRWERSPRARKLVVPASHLALIDREAKRMGWTRAETIRDAIDAYASTLDADDPLY